MRDHQLAVMARKDFDDAIRSKAIWIISGLFALLMILLAYMVSRGAPAELSGTQRRLIPLILLSGLTQWITWVVTLLALVGGYASIIDERRTGSIKLLLGQPFQRVEVLVGKIIGRVSVIAAATLVGFLAIALSITVLIGPPVIVDFTWRFLGLFLLTVLLGGIFTVLAVSVSAIVSTRRRAMMSVIAIFFVLQAAWTGVTQLFYLFFSGGSALPARPPTWYIFLTYLSPSAAYTRLSSVVFPSPPIRPPQYHGLGLDGVPQRAIQAQQSGSFLLSEYMALLILLIWAVAVGLVGYRAFQNADLG